MVSGDAKKWLLLLAVIAALWAANRYAPDTDPVSPPEPPPVVAVDPAAFVFTIRQSEQQTPAVTVLLNDPYWDELRGQSISVLHYDLDDPAVASYRAVAEELGLPCLFAIKADGTVLLKRKLPATVGEVRTAVGPFVGKLSADSSSTTPPREQSSVLLRPSRSLSMEPLALRFG